jgi:hypothetical protein
MDKISITIIQIKHGTIFIEKENTIIQILEEIQLNKKDILSYYKIIFLTISKSFILNHRYLFFNQREGVKHTRAHVSPYLSVHFAASRIFRSKKSPGGGRKERTRFSPPSSKALAAPLPPPPSGPHNPMSHLSYPPRQMTNY